MLVTDCIIIDSERHVQHFFKEAWRNHYPSGFTIEEIVVCLTKVYQEQRSKKINFIKSKYYKIRITN